MKFITIFALIAAASAIRIQKENPAWHCKCMGTTCSDHDSAACKKYHEPAAGDAKCQGGARTTCTTGAAQPVEWEEINKTNFYHHAHELLSQVNWLGHEGKIFASDIYTI